MKNHPGLPAGWMASQIGAVSRVVAGYGFPLELQGKASGDFPFFKVGDISRAWVAGQDELSRTDHYLTEDEAATIRARPFPAGTTVFAKIGAAIALNRRALLCRPSLIDNNVMGLIPHDGCLDRRFLFHFTKTLRLDGLSQATTVPSLRKGDVESIDIPLPPLNEQRRIVAKIEDLTARSQAAKQALDAIPPLLERFRQSVLAAAFRGDLTKQWRQQNPNVEPASELLKRIRQERRHRWEQDYLAQQKAKGKTPKDDKWKEKYVEPESVDTTGLPELPAGWCWVSVASLIPEESPLCYGVVQPGPLVDQGVPLIRVCDIGSDGTIDFPALRTISTNVDAEYARSRLSGGEVLVSIVGTIGRVAVVPAEAARMNIARAIARVALVRLSPEWLASYLSTIEIQDWLNRGAREVARKTLNLHVLKELVVPIAPEVEIAEILKHVSATTASRLAIARAIQDANAQHAKLDQSILAKAFRGELVPQDPNDEPASALLGRINAEREAVDSPGESGKKRKGRGR